MSETVTLNHTNFTIRPMTGDDSASVLAFAKSLPTHDLLFLRRDITQEKVVDAWISQTESGAFDTLVAEKDGAIVGSVALFTDPHSWSPHLGDIRVLVSPDARQHGLGRHLIEQGFRVALDKGLKKLTAQMTVDQKGAIIVFEEMGFSGEALLKDQVCDSAGAMHDIVILSCDIERASERLKALGKVTAG